jgi:peptide/nickel transport system ATP-binding protein
MGEMPILEVRNLAVNYRTRTGEVKALRDASFGISRGESLGLVGESGCGKSTAAFAVVGFLGPNGRVVNGNILFKGQELVGRSPKQLRSVRGSEISMVYQEPMSSLNPSMRIEHQMIEALVAHQNISRAAARDQCVQVLQRVSMPDIERVLDHYAHELSGGQQQRVLIAMAILNNPALLIMDEPTTALDVTVEAAVLDLIANLTQTLETATLYITHNLGVVARVADRVAVMYAGEVVEVAPTETIFHTPLHPYTVGLMQSLPDVDAPKGTKRLRPIGGQVPAPDEVLPGCSFSPRCEYSVVGCTTHHPRLEEVVQGHTARCSRLQEWLSSPPWHEERCRGEKVAEERLYEQRRRILEAAHIRVYYPVAGRSVADMFRKKRHVRAVDDVSMTMREGCTLGVVGESGCGKSTLAKALVGLEPLAGGQIEFLGVDISEPIRKRDISVIREMQMVFQDPESVLNPSYSVGYQIAASLKRFRVVPRNQVYDEVVRLLKAVKLDEQFYHRRPKQLSGGEKQRVGIARAIAAHPSVIVCDEPVSSLDVSVQASVLMLLSEIQQEYNTSMILISHDLSTVRFLSDYVAVMYLGQIVEEGPCEAIYSPPYHPYTAVLLAAVPRPNPDQKVTEFRLTGTVPSAVSPPTGCRFHTRCPMTLGSICENEVPPTRDFGGGHKIWCHLPESELARLLPYGCASTAQGRI